ncbi:hypothetical protein M529_08095 [Sphingobium ummariense RL-3]|uniref:Uncharacterized protein n=1 Tax=Sphingobium ummariense RL-3 TaxID=1346791 RepID=T0IVD1_9SPHN|nr:hypothetical protein M529_08095 [Sphingobium ummariense RL-3]
MLDDIAVGPLAEQPAGKVAPPLAVRRAAHVQLHEGAGFLHILPGRAGLAGLQPHDRVARAQRLARLHLQVHGDAVALVQQADHRDSLGHRRAGQRGVLRGAHGTALDADGAGLVGRGNIVAAAGGQHRRAAQRCERQDRQDAPRRAPDHDASGLHAS